MHKVTLHKWGNNESYKKNEDSEGNSYTSGVTNLFETESYFLVQIHAKDYRFHTHLSEEKFAKFVFNYVIIIKIQDIHQCEDNDHWCNKFFDQKF